MAFKRSLLSKILRWRLRHVSNRNFMLIVSVIVGLLAGLGAVVLKNSVHLIQSFLTSEALLGFHNYLYFIYPTIGIFLVFLFIKNIIKQNVGHGIPTALYAISTTNGVIKPHNMYSSIISSALTVGFGGSVGLEGPTVATGAAIGSNLGKLLHLNYKQILLLIGCAAAGAMSAIFKSPIAAVVFVLEVMMLDLTMSSLVPLLLASASAALTSYLFFGQDVLYSFEITQKFRIAEVPLFVLFGILAGLMSVYFTRVYVSIGNRFDKIRNPRKKLLIGGGLLGTLVFLFPMLYGEGYETINQCLHGNYQFLYNDSMYLGFKNQIFFTVLLFLAAMLLKVVATSLTFGAGGVGGIFAPTLFTGAVTGLFFATVYNSVFTTQISESNFALVGMAGLISGVLHAPLTAIFLIAEITMAYELFMPLMITATISYSTIKYFESNSVYTIQLARRKQLFTHDKDKVVLKMLKVQKLIETNFHTVRLDASLGDLVKIITQSSRNIFPVIDDENNFYGFVRLDDIRDIMFKQDLYDNTWVRNLMVKPEVYISPNETMEEVAQKFHLSGKFNIPVLDKGKYVGFISRARVFSSYRQLLKKWSED